MSRWSLAAVRTVSACLAWSAAGLGQAPPAAPAPAPAPIQSQGPPVLAGINPPAARVGATTDWVLAGKNLGRVDAVRVSGSGVKVELAGLVAAETVAGMVVADETLKVRVVVDPDAETGYREVRLDGAGGLSNLALIRVDRLPQVVEAEPNEKPEQAQKVEAGSAIVGQLRPLDVDHYRVEGTPGRRLTIDLEARRVGLSIAPVVTLFDPSGRSLAQGREAPGGDRDCRMSLAVPPEGWFVVQVRDNTYGGTGQAHYRLRIDPAPYASAVFPLGGPKGSTIEVELSGGNLPGPIRKSVRLPDRAGALVEVGPADGPLGPVAVPGRLIAGDGPEATEPAELAAGTTANGRIARAGEVDTYRVAVLAGRKYRVKVEAAAMGSWLDSVVLVRDEGGATLAENDDTAEAISAASARSVSALGVPEGSPDSSVEFEAKADGFASVLVTDRFGDGGPEYGYRLAVGPGRADFAVTLLLGGVNANAGALNTLGAARNARVSPGLFGVFNLKPGASVPINFLVAPEGRPGPVTLRVEGLPYGVTAAPVVVSFPGPLAPGQPGSAGSPAAVADSLAIKVAPYAVPGYAEFRVVASARTDPASPIEREASATIGIDTSAVGPRPITRVVARFPLRIVGDARPSFVGPPTPPTLRKVVVPGPLLVGDRIVLGLEFDRSITADDGSVLEAVAEGVGLFANTIVSAGGSVTDDEASPEAVVRVLASAKAKPGPYRIKVTYAPPGGSRSVHEVTVEVRAPVTLEAPASDLFLRPGDTLKLAIKLRRQAGFDGEVELKLEGLPRGVKVAKAVTIPAGADSGEVALEMAGTAKPLARSSEIRVVGMARAGGSTVVVESPNRPILKPRPADN